MWTSQGTGLGVTLWYAPTWQLSVKNHAGCKALGKGGSQVNPRNKQVFKKQVLQFSAYARGHPQAGKQLLLPISSSAALSFSLPTFGMDCSQCLFEVRKHLLIIQLGRQDAGKAHFPRLHWESSRWSTYQNEDTPGKLQNFASELSQTSTSSAALNAQSKSQAAGQVEHKAVCFLKEQAPACMCRNLGVKLWALLSSVFTGAV